MAAPGNATSPYCRAVRLHSEERFCLLHWKKPYQLKNSDQM